MNKPININEFIKNGGEINMNNFINKFILISSKKRKVLLYVASKNLTFQLLQSNKYLFNNYFYDLNKEYILEYIKYGLNIYIF